MKIQYFDGPEALEEKPKEAPKPAAIPMPVPTMRAGRRILSQTEVLKQVFTEGVKRELVLADLGISRLCDEVIPFNKETNPLWIAIQDMPEQSNVELIQYILEVTKKHYGGAFVIFMKDKLVGLYGNDL